MRDEELDRILGGEPGIVPSSGFTGGVMEAVRREAATPPPIPFPWKCAAPGLAAWGVAVGALVLASPPRAGNPEATASIWAPWAAGLARALEAANRFGTGWIGLALLLAFASVMLSLRLTASRS